VLLASSRIEFSPLVKTVPRRLAANLFSAPLTESRGSIDRSPFVTRSEPATAAYTRADLFNNNAARTYFQPSRLSRLLG